MCNWKWVKLDDWWRKLNHSKYSWKKEWERTKKKWTTWEKQYDISRFVEKEFWCDINGKNQSNVVRREVWTSKSFQRKWKIHIQYSNGNPNTSSTTQYPTRRRKIRRNLNKFRSSTCKKKCCGRNLIFFSSVFLSSPFILVHMLSNYRVTFENQEEDDEKLMKIAI